MESFVVPAALAGRRGSNRHAGQARIQAANDLQAVQFWLATKSGSPNTERAYRKEAERLMLWAVIERRKALSDLTVDDCTAYRDWLSALGRTPAEEWPFGVPQNDWIGKRNTPRFSLNWRPFDGPLSPTSTRQALSIVSSLFEWLVRVQYCAFNPWDAVGRKLAPCDDAPADIELTRVFSEAPWRYLTEHLEHLPVDAHTERLRFTLPFAYATGLRLSELVDAKTARLYTMPLRDTLWLSGLIPDGNYSRSVYDWKRRLLRMAGGIRSVAGRAMIAARKNEMQGDIKNSAQAGADTESDEEATAAIPVPSV